MDTILGLDFGTQGAKGIIIKTNGEVSASAYRPYQYICNRQGWIEQNPEDWWKALKDICVRLRQKNAPAFDKISAIGLSGQMHGVILMGKGGSIARNAILWPDSRAGNECRMMELVLDEEDRKVLSNPVTSTYSAPKILWVREQETETWEETEKVLFTKDYIKYRLCGNICTDPSDASGTLLYNFMTDAWDERVLLKLGIKSSLLPDILKSAEICGRTNHEASAELGIKSGIPVVNGAGDLACGLLGSGIASENVVSIILGTAGQVMALNRSIQEEKTGKVYFFKHADSKHYFSLGALNSAGYCLRWLAEILGGNAACSAKNEEINIFELLEKEAEKSPAGANGLVFLPYLLGTGSPYMNDMARGTFIGLGSYHARKDLIRSLMEGVIMGIKDSVGLMKAQNLFESVRFAGGGSKSPLWNRILADILGCRVTTLVVKDASPYGAALIAGIGAGLFRDFNAAASLVRLNNTVEPVADSVEKYEKLYAIYKDAYKSLEKIFADMAKFNSGTYGAL